MLASFFIPPGYFVRSAVCAAGDVLVSPSHHYIGAVPAAATDKILPDTLDQRHAQRYVLFG